jgi:hypothetical protein
MYGKKRLSRIQILSTPQEKNGACATDLGAEKDQSTDST